MDPDPDYFIIKNYFFKFCEKESCLFDISFDYEGISSKEMNKLEKKAPTKFEKRYGKIFKIF